MELGGLCVEARHDPQVRLVVHAARSRTWSERAFRFDSRTSAREALSMHTFETVDEALAAVGWAYDPKKEQITNGKRRMSYRKVLALVPGLTLQELASYVSHKHDQRGPDRQ
jgi:hypothetical protein